jgi:hypothetical protein
MKKQIFKILLLTLMLGFSTLLKAASPSAVTISNGGVCPLTFTLSEAASYGGTYVITLAPGEQKQIYTEHPIESCSVTDGTNTYNLNGNITLSHVVLCSSEESITMNGNDGDLGIWIVDDNQQK